MFVLKEEFEGEETRPFQKRQRSVQPVKYSLIDPFLIVYENILFILNKIARKKRIKKYVIDNYLFCIIFSGDLSQEINAKISFSRG